MTYKVLLVVFVYFQVVHSQYYCVPSSNYPSYGYNYYSNPTPPALIPTHQNVKIPSKTPKQSIPPPPSVKCSPQTASAYFLSTPTEKVKATVLPEKIVKKTIAPPPTEKVKETTILAPSYSCPLCNNFADVPPNPKIPPPPPIGSPVLPETFDKVPSVAIAKDLFKNDLDSLLSSKTSLLSDMYEKHKLPKNLSFDQELLEGFLTGLGIASL